MSAAELPDGPDTSPFEDNTQLHPPGSFARLDSPFNSVRYSNASQSAFASTPPPSAPLMLGADASSAGLNEKVPTKRKSRKLLYLGICALLLVIVVLAVILPVYFTIIRPKHQSASSDIAANGPGKGSSSQPAGSTGTTPPGSSQALAITGGDGTLITLADGSTLTYHNSFGGSWYYDPSNPFANAARPQSWVPALNETWTFGKDQIRG